MAQLDKETVIGGSEIFEEFKGSHPGVKAVRFSLSGYREQDWMRNVPLYAMSNMGLWG